MLDIEDDPDLEDVLPDAGLEKLAGLRDFYVRNLESGIEAADAIGGVRDREGVRNKMDEFAIEMDEKHLMTQRELLERLDEIHFERSRKARIADESLRARKTTDPTQWASDPARWDYPGIDLPPE